MKHKSRDCLMMHENQDHYFLIVSCVESASAVDEIIDLLHEKNNLRERSSITSAHLGGGLLTYICKIVNDYFQKAKNFHTIV